MFTKNIREIYQGWSANKTGNKQIQTKHFGFTLAEVLITLGIIGIVAAITIPILISKYNKTMTEVRLKETYSKLTNMAKLSEAEFGAFDPSGDLTSVNFTKENGKIVFEKYFMPFIKINFKYSDSDCVNLSKSYGQSSNSQMYRDSNGACYNLMNGTSVIFWAGKQTTDFYLYPMRIIINPNKEKKIEGRDVFSFYIAFTENGVQFSSFPRIMGLNLTDEQLRNFCNSNSSRINFAGYSMDRSCYCSELLLKNGLKIPAKYPIKF